MAKVMVGLSGGVDSAVSAYLLQRDGHETVAGFMRNWDSATNNDVQGNPHVLDDICPQEVDYQDAQAVANHLAMKLYRVDFIKEYWDYVFTYFLHEYKQGRTPNPDVLCNKFIKFDAFLKFSTHHGYDFIAMGHYAQVRHLEDGTVQLLRGVDGNKDQSYFLSLLTQAQLKRTMFPIGHLTKPEVRAIAAQLNLPVATKKDSTGICFIGERDFKLFLENYIPAQPGDIVDVRNNTVIGHHRGVMYYTIGQRKGLGIGGIKDHEQGSWFVVQKNIDKAILYVSQGDENKWLFHHGCSVKDVNWIAPTHPETMHCTAKFRYRQADIAVTIRFVNDATIEVIGDQPIKSLTPGQMAVFYDGDVCLGGGTIDELRG